MDCTLNLIDVRDAALGLHLVMKHGSIGRRYLLGSTNLTLLGLLEHLGHLTGVPAPRWKVPYPVGISVAWLSETWANHVSGRMPRATLTGLRLARRLMHFDSSRSLAELGLEPRNIEQSLGDAVAWLRSSGLLAQRATPINFEPVPGIIAHISIPGIVDLACCRGFRR